MLGLRSLTEKFRAGEEPNLVVKQLKRLKITAPLTERSESEWLQPSLEWLDRKYPTEAGRGKADVAIGSDEKSHTVFSS